MARKETWKKSSEYENSGHQGKMITLWVPDDVLKRWDARAKQVGVKRSAYIITTVNREIEMTEKSKIDTDIAAREEKLAELTKKATEALSKVAAKQEETQSITPDMKGQVLFVLKRISPIRFEELAKITGINAKILIPLIAQLTDVEKLVKVNPKSGELELVNYGHEK